MKLFLFFAFLAVLATTAIAWEKEDHEIFDLVYEVEKSEGKGTTFYSWLDVQPTATIAEIGKAYRKLSMQLHPDKNPNVKGIHERFARLGVVSTILRNKESRKRYDFFYKNGVPRWRGTGYYYSRFRPGLGSVLVFLTIITSGLQYMIQRINYKRDLQRIEDIINRARLAAWGPKLVPLPGKRKVKVGLGAGKDEDGNADSKQLDMVVEGDDVFILERGGAMIPISASTATIPSIGHTWFINLIKGLYHKVVRRSTQAPDMDDAPGQDDAESDGGSSSTTSEYIASGTVTPSDTGKARIMPTTKAGGRRRKAVRQR